MDIRGSFDKRVFISRADRQDRREKLIPCLSAIGLHDTVWFQAIDCGLLKDDTRGFLSVAKRSCALGKRLVLRQARISGSSAILLLEDDVVFHPRFKFLIEQLDLPKDWGIFYFGCQHTEPPDWAGPSIVRVRRALDMHAVAINSNYFLQVSAAMRGYGKGRQGQLHSDYLLSDLHKSIPTYAAYPNLAWQMENYSDNLQKNVSQYHPDGHQKWNFKQVAHLSTIGAHPIYRIQNGKTCSTKASESLKGLFVINIAIKMPNGTNKEKFQKYTAEISLFRSFLKTSQQFAVIIEENTILVDRGWLVLTQFDYLQPFNTKSLLPVSSSVFFDNISQKPPFAYLASRAFAKAYIRLFEIGAPYHMLHFLASRGLKAGALAKDGVVFDEDDVLENRKPLLHCAKGSHKFNRHVVRPRLQNVHIKSVSFCMLCYQHRSHLEITLSRNLEEARKHNAEIVIVDWCSKDSLSKWISKRFSQALSNGRLQLYALREQLPFNTSIGKNFAHRFASGEIIVNLNPDNFIGDLCYGSQLAESDEFLACEEYGKGTLGRLGFSREALEKLGGYDESLENAGHGEIDIKMRAVSLGFKKHNWPCSIEPYNHIKTRKINFARVGGHAIWKQMTERNILRSQKNLRDGVFIANSSGFAEASFNHNLKNIVRLTKFNYFG